MGRKIYIDLGAHDGSTIQAFRADNPEFIIFAFEPNPRLAAILRGAFAGTGSNVHVMEAAAWIFDGAVKLYFGERSDQSTTIIPGKRTPDWPVDYAHPHTVLAIDFDRWFRENTSADDHVVIKMDIEGAEYRLLRRLIDTGSLGRAAELRVEWHWDRYPDEISETDHAALREKVGKITKLTDWR
jgi:FkbM family methyltransferase